MWVGWGKDGGWGMGEEGERERVGLTYFTFGFRVDFPHCEKFFGVSCYRRVICIVVVILVLLIVIISKK